jgi:hypothetical protein
MENALRYLAQVFDDHACIAADARQRELAVANAA